MYISGPSSWAPELIVGLTRINRAPCTKIPIKEVYGTQQRTPVGGGRPAWNIPDVSDEEVEKQVVLAHGSGIEVNYLLNALCSGLREFDPKFHAELLEFLGRLDSIGIDCVTVTSTRLMGIIARQFPRLKIVVSINGEVDTPQKARYYVDQYDVSRINLDFNVTRDFKQIAAIRKAVDCSLEVLINEPCLIYCPWKHDHQLDYAHCSQTSKDVHLLYAIDTPQCHCGLIRIEDWSQILKAPWLRPEDTVHLEDLGVDYIKLAGRAKPTVWILESVQAYAQQHFEGNVYNLIEKSGICAPEYAVCFGDDGMKPSGEIIYADDADIVLCRRWCWRQADKTKLTPETRNVAINLDCLPPVTRQEAEVVVNELTELIAKYCGGKTSSYWLDVDNPQAEIWH